MQNKIVSPKNLLLSFDEESLNEEDHLTCVNFNIDSYLEEVALLENMERTDELAVEAFFCEFPSFKQESNSVETY